MTRGEPRLVPANLIWDRRGAAFGLLLAVPGTAVIALGHVKPGVELLVGMLVAALVGVAPARAKRKSMLVVGLLLAVSISIGALLATEPWLAVPGIALIAIRAAQAAAARPLGFLAMNLCLPTMGTDRRRLRRRLARGAARRARCALVGLRAHRPGGPRRTRGDAGIAYLFGLAVPRVIAGRSHALAH